jgi:hypothetical protein
VTSGGRHHRSVRRVRAEICARLGAPTPAVIVSSSSVQALGVLIGTSNTVTVGSRR